MDEKTKPGLNYIQLINQFWRVFREYEIEGNKSKPKKINGSEALLYFGLLDKCNSLNWKNPFRETEDHLGKTLGMNFKTVRNARMQLVEAGLIQVQIPKTASKSVEGSTYYFIVENVPTTPKKGAVQESEPLQNFPATTPKKGDQPLQNFPPTAPKNGVNNKPSLKPPLKPSFKEEREKKYDENDLKKSYARILYAIKYHSSFFKDKQFTEQEFNSYLQKYLPEEIEKALSIACSFFVKDKCEDLSISEMLDAILPVEKQKRDNLFNSIMKDCTGILSMSEQLTTYEKMQLLKCSDFDCLQKSFQEVESHDYYRKNKTVYEAVKDNLVAFKNWKENGKKDRTNYAHEYFMEQSFKENPDVPGL